MLKYASIDSYNAMGEVGCMCSHVYQFMECQDSNPMIILVHAYECETVVFKGYLYNGTKTFKSVDLLETEKKAIEWYTGKLKQVSLLEFIKGTIFEDSCKDFREAEQSQ